MKHLSLTLLALSTLALVACDNSVDAGDDNPGGGGSAGTTSSQQGLCSSASPCPSGQFCFNGLCALGCQNDDDCASEQYCDTSEFGDRLCHNKVVASCPETPCAATQECINGLCSTPPGETKCDPEQVVNGQDGCDSHAICLQEEEGAAAKCYSFPPCAQDGSCPTGLYGAVCNDGYVPNKARICLTSLCSDESNCPASWKCVKIMAGSVLGSCSNGSTGTMCSSAEDCLSANCMGAGMGVPGICM